MRIICTDTPHYVQDGYKEKDYIGHWRSVKHMDERHDKRSDERTLPLGTVKRLQEATDLLPQAGQKRRAESAVGGEKGGGSRKRARAGKTHPSNVPIHCHKCGNQHNRQLGNHCSRCNKCFDYRQLKAGHRCPKCKSRLKNKQVQKGSGGGMVGGSSAASARREEDYKGKSQISGKQTDCPRCKKVSACRWMEVIS